MNPTRIKSEKSLQQNMSLEYHKDDALDDFLKWMIIA